jgi:hypothetical protein
VDKVFGVLVLGVLCHSDEHQFLLRVRPDDQREEPMEVFIQKGAAGREETGHQAKWDQARRRTTNPAVASALADIECERADTQNRHMWLFRNDPECWSLHPLVGTEEDVARKPKIAKLVRGSTSRFKNTLYSSFTSDKSDEQIGHLETLTVAAMHQSIKVSFV